MDLTNTLLGCHSPDTQIRNDAEKALGEAASTNAGPFMLALVKELAGEDKPEVARQQAGLYVKNMLTATDTVVYEAKIMAWESIDANTKNEIKTTSLQALCSTNALVSRAAAQVVAKIGIIELPRDKWPDLVQNLVGQVTDATRPNLVKVSCLQTIGYMCEELAADALETAVTNSMLTAIIEGMAPTTAEDIRLAAVSALRSSLDFCSENMKVKMERDMIMQRTCECTQSPSNPVREMAFQCICLVAQLYYAHIGDYMAALAGLTFQAVPNDAEEVGKQGIEFWSTLCEEEMDIIEEALEFAEAEEPPTRQCSNFIENALPQLLPVLLQALTKQSEEDMDDDAWTTAMAAATCLGLVANTVGDKVIEGVLPFVHANIQNQDWHFREAAVQSFGAIVEGCSTSSQMKQLLQSGMQMFLNLVQDPHPQIRDTAAWTIGRICEFCSTDVPSELFEPLLRCLLLALDDEISVANQACYALHNVAQAVADSNSSTDTNPLSPHMSTILSKLFEIAEKASTSTSTGQSGSGGERNLMASAYEAVCVFVEVSADDVRQVLVDMLPALLQRLENSFSKQFLSAEDRDETSTLQGMICGALQSVTMKLEQPALLPVADRMMELYLRVLGLRTNEETFLAVGALADKCEQQFQKYMPTFKEALLVGLRCTAEYQVCATAVGVVGDICRALEKSVAGYCDEIMLALLDAVKNQDLHMSVKSQLLSAFSDVALAIGGGYSRYLNVTSQVLYQASSVQLNPDDDEDHYDFVQTLRESILEAYTGIVQGMHTDGKADQLVILLPQVQEFLTVIANDSTRYSSVTKNAVALLGDLAQALGAMAKPLLSQPMVTHLLTAGNQNSDDTIKELSQWSAQLVGGVLSM